jgi:steroid 5-alpha reductase family enzyme
VIDPKNVLQLLNMTLIFAAASALTHQLVWLLLERPHLNIWVDIWPMFVGNALGALLMLYGFKFVLDRVRRKA